MMDAGINEITNTEAMTRAPRDWVYFIWTELNLIHNLKNQLHRQIYVDPQKATFSHLTRLGSRLQRLM